MEAAVFSEKNPYKFQTTRRHTIVEFPPRKTWISLFRIPFCFPNFWISNNHNFDRCLVCGWKMVFVL